MTIALERPSWHEQAACRGDARWLVDDGRVGKGLGPLRQVCRSCPVAGACLAEALGLPAPMRHAGVLRCGVNGPEAWQYAERVVAELGPVTPEDWSAVATWLLDGDLEDLDPPPVQRCRPATPTRVVVAPKAGLFPKLWHYDVVPAGHTFTRAEIVASRT